jgi:hypothetical protein
MRILPFGLCLLAAPVSAQVVPDPGATPRVQTAHVDGQLVLRRALVGSGLAVPGVAELLQADGAGVLVRTRRALTTAEQARLGVRSIGVDERIYTGWVRWTDLQSLAQQPLVERIEPTKRLLEAQPLETIGARQGSLRAHLRPTDGLTGDGIVVAAIDQPVDVLHPHFVHADGGVFEWLDANNSGAFEGGDAVLFDDATVGRLVVLDGFFFDPVTNPADWQNIDDTLNPRLDWLFADLNGDGIRNAGAADGFDDDSPSLGEPMFVAHDANENGRLDPEEKLFGLGTSKVRRMWVGNQTYTRGENMAAAAGVPLQTDASHGTGVASILLGGQPGFHDRVGLAPGAEYVGYANVDEGRMGLVFADAEEQGAMLMLHEWSQPVGAAGDGGSIFEGSMDAARARGMLQVCPLGNLNSAGKQVELTVAGQTRLTFRVGDGFFNGQQTVPYGYVQAHLAWRAEQDPGAIQLVRPNGVAINLDFSGDPLPLGDNNFIAATLERTARGTGFANLILFKGDGFSESLPQGEWAIMVDGLPEGTVLHGRITDAWSGWSEGIGWGRPTRDRTSLTYPSTADSSIGVAAYGGRMDMRDFGDSNVGDLRFYSGRGPRIDGAQAVDIAAPDDPLAAQHPEWDADAIEARLFESTRTQGLQPDLGALPNGGWGFGKLNLHQTLYDALPDLENQGPAIRGSDGAWVEAGYQLTVDATDPEDDPLHYRWDLAYDGVWAGEWSTEPTLVLDDAAPNDELTVRIAVRDEWGGVAERIEQVVVPEPPAPEPDAQPEPQPEGQPEPQPEGEPEGPEPEGQPEAPEPEGAEPEAPGTDGETRAARSTDGCTTTGRGSGGAWWLLLMGWVARRRR